MQFLAVLFILSVFFLPASMMVRPDYILSIVLCVLGYLKFGDLFVKLSGKETRLLFWLSVFAVVSILGQVVSGLSLSPRDFMVILRYVVYLAAIYAGIVTALSVRKSMLFRWLGLVLVVFTVIISFSQYFNVGGINSTLVPLYSTADRYAHLEAGESWRRIIGTMGNPNYWGFFLGLGFIYSSYMCLQRRYIYLILAVPLFMSIIMTGSRTTLIAVMVSLLFGFFRAASVGNKVTFKSFVPILAGLLFLGAMYLVFNIFSANYYEAENRFSITTLDTLELRIQWWFEIFHNMIAQPHTFVIGKGPAKLDSIRFGDNMYIRYLRDFGLIGLILYIALLRHILCKLSGFSQKVDKSLAIFFSIILLGFVQLVVFDLAADGWFNVRIVQLLLFAYGMSLGFSYKKNRCRSRDESIYHHS